ncbi:MAG TPA: S1 family peptidase [Gemmatimonadales bacterium]|nr:S1 family peptidase [Gemmatimonadales bacterium]
MDDPTALARQVPGFGGFFFDQQGRPTIYLKDLSQRAAAERVLTPYLDVQGGGTTALQVRRADYDWASLERWQNQASAEALAMQGTVWVDADEAKNRVTIAVQRGASAAQVRSAVSRLGLPAAAVVIEEVEPIKQVATLRQQIRPVRGGLQINFPGFLCTLGFNANRSGQRSFITNSHCTSVQGGVENTPYWQPTQAASAQIGTEVADPTYGRPSGCPLLRRCRRSDAARVAYADGIRRTLGVIARTTGANNGSLTISGSFSIAAEGSPAVGQTANKVGRTTGWTSGEITHTCVHVNVSGSNITQLCQSIVEANVGSGDSGSPVFRRTGSGSDVTLLGILWGGGTGVFVFSPISGIESELGALRTF